MKIKDISSTLGGLLDQANKTAQSGGAYNVPGTQAPGTQVYGSPEDSIPEELQDEPIFTMDYKSEQQRCISKAKQSILIIVKQVVPEQLQQMPLIRDKINQDAEQLGNLYYQYQKKETYHQALMDVIARGDHSPKAFDVCEKISASLENLGTAITNTQNQLRKYYIDAYKDLQYKVDEDEVLEAKAQMKGLVDDDDSPKLISPMPEVNNQNAKLENRMVGTESLSRTLAEMRKRKLKPQTDNQGSI